MYGWFGKHVPTKLSFLFNKERLLFGAPLTRTKLTFGLSDVFTRDGISRVGPLLPRYTILRSTENMPQYLRGFLGNFNVVASQKSFYGFRNATNGRHNRKFVALRKTLDAPDYDTRQVCRNVGS